MIQFFKYGVTHNMQVVQFHGVEAERSEITYGRRADQE